MTRLVQLPLLAILISCNAGDEKQSGQPPRATPSYFDFDQATHYRISDSAEASVPMDTGGMELNDNEKYLHGYLYGSVTGWNNRSSGFAFLSDIGFTGHAISAEKNTALNEIFSARNVDEAWGAECVPVYRDILVFEKEGQVTGLAKICFSCEQYIFKGAKTNTFGFGMNREFDQLFKLLNK